MRWLLPLALTSIPLFGGLSVQIAVPLQTPPLVGTPLTFTATAADTNPGTIDYQFSVSQNGADYQVVEDFNSYNFVTWTPSLQEGAYTMQVTARNKAAAETASSTILVSVQSRIVDGKPVITPTANPLVALYSVPPCAVGSYVVVYFTGNGSTNHTDRRVCAGSVSTNFYIAGMLPNTTYSIYHIVTTGNRRNSFRIPRHLDVLAVVAHTSPALNFTTGSLPANLTFAVPTLLTPPTTQSDGTQNVLLCDNLSLDAYPLYYFPTATDLSGNTLWYYPALADPLQESAYYIRPVNGGTFMLIAADPASAFLRGQIFREIDLAGNTVRETNATRVSEQLNALGLLGITDFDHDAIRLPNGHSLVLCSQERMYPAGTQGSTGPIDIIGNAIVDLDANFQVVWAWSGYDHLDVNRPAVLGETCPPNTAGCPPVALAPLAADWMHGNSLYYIPSSGDLILSVRHQDWVVKIDYKDGTGSGDVLWKLGKDGSFSIISNDPYPWFSHQHDAQFQLGGTTILSLYDNGNTRAGENPSVKEDSRGMVLSLDETALTATPILLQDLGVLSAAVGSAQRLENGNYFFDSGFIGPANQVSQHSEFTLSGTETYLLQTSDFSYRSYRMESLYQLDDLGN